MTNEDRIERLETLLRNVILTGEIRAVRQPEGDLGYTYDVQLRGGAWPRSTRALEAGLLLGVPDLTQPEYRDRSLYVGYDVGDVVLVAQHGGNEGAPFILGLVRSRLRGPQPYGPFIAAYTNPDAEQTLPPGSLLFLTGDGIVLSSPAIKVKRHDANRSYRLLAVPVDDADGAAVAGLSVAMMPGDGGWLGLRLDLTESRLVITFKGDSVSWGAAHTETESAGSHSHSGYTGSGGSPPHGHSVVISSAGDHSHDHDVTHVHEVELGEEDLDGDALLHLPLAPAASLIDPSAIVMPPGDSHPYAAEEENGDGD